MHRQHSVTTNYYIIEFSCLYRNGQKSAVDTGHPQDDLTSLNFFSDTHYDYDYGKINWENVRSKLHEVDWRAEFPDLEPNELLENLTNICFNVMMDRVPVKKCCNTKGRKGQCLSKDQKLYEYNTQS